MDSVVAELSFDFWLMFSKSQDKVLKEHREKVWQLKLEDIAQSESEVKNEL